MEVGINELEYFKNRISETKSGFFEKLNRIDKPQETV